MTENFEEEEPIFKEHTDASMFDFAYPATRIFQADDRWHYGREPVLRRMPDGSWVCLIYSGGKREPARENCVLITRSGDDGRIWSEPQVLFAHGERCVWATELFTGLDQPAIFVQTFIYDTYYFEIKTFCSSSPDSGRSWSEPCSVHGVCGNASVRKGITLSDGTLLLPVYWMEMLQGFNWDRHLAQAAQSHTPVFLTEKVKCQFCCGVWLSRDGGRTWSQHGSVTLPFGKYCWGGWEPNVVELGSGRLVMLMRADGSGCLWRSDSDDRGRTWSPPYPTAIANPGSKFDLLNLQGRIVLLHNPDPQVRHSLALWVSKDDMQTWSIKRELSRSRQPGRWICYPHACPDDARQTLYVASDAVKEFYLQQIPYRDILC